MRYVTVPEPVEIVLEGGDKQEYSFQNHFDNNVAGAPVFRDASNATLYDIWCSLMSKCRGAHIKPGVEIALTDAEFEQFAPLWMMSGRGQLNPYLADGLMKIMACVVKATKEPRLPSQAA